MSSQNVVIDLGSSQIKVGFAGAKSPTLVPTVEGIQRGSSELAMIECGSKDYYYGEEAMLKKGILTLRNPVQRGIVKDWDSMENIFHYIFEDVLKVSIKNSGVLITEPALNPKSNSEKLCQLLFEKFEVPGVIMATDSKLSMVATGGYNTGLMFSSGAGVTTVVPIYEGFVIERGVRRLDLGGDDVTRYLSKLFLEAGYSFKTSAELKILENMKNSLAYIVQDFNREMVDYWTHWDPNRDRSYKLPDGNTVCITTEPFECSESLFHPSHLGREHKGIQNLIYDSIQACSIDIRRDLCKNIILSGGNTMFPGMPERIHKEIVNLSPPKSIFKVVSQPDRKNLTWNGGSIIGSLSHYSPWIDRREYDDYGPVVVHSKRF